MAILAQTAAAEDTRHRRIPEDRAERNRHADEQRRARLADQNLDDDRAVGRAHALCRLNDALIDLVERRLDHTRDKRRRRDNKGDDRRRRAVALADQPLGKRRDQNQQNQKRHTSDQVHNDVQNAIDDRVSADAVFARDTKKNPERKPQQVAESSGRQNHVQRIADAFDQRLHHSGFKHVLRPPIPSSYAP